MYIGPWQEYRLSQAISEKRGVKKKANRPKEGKKPRPAEIIARGNVEEKSRSICGDSEIEGNAEKRFKTLLTNIVNHKAEFFHFIRNEMACKSKDEKTEEDINEVNLLAWVDKL
eukprot:snap_masked-scaffold_33-processed-gene-1.12-mRNA-1 protein AED:1.00 eAED:1.00 QI:0/-1/0/0/-1/1/1/0/113